MRQKRVRRQRVFGMFVGLAFVLLTPASALGAVTVSASGATMSVAGDAAANTINLGGDPAVPNGQGTASAPGIELAPSMDTRCTKVDDTVTCTGTAMAPISTFNADGAGGDDTLAIDTTRFWVARGGLGDDSLSGSDGGNERLLGDAGNDSLYSRGAPSNSFIGGGSFGGADDDLVQGGPGIDSLSGGDGTDQVLGDASGDGLSGGPGDGDVVDGGAAGDFLYEGGGDGTDDVLSGGAGVDDIFYRDSTGVGSPDSFAVNLATGQASRTNNGGANSDSLADIEDVTTVEGADSLTGAAGTNNLSGSGGNDTILGGDGNDSLFGGTGDDSVQDRDGFRDTVDCGPGNDEALLDQLDTQTNCESPQEATTAPSGSVAPTATTPPPPPTPPDVTPPQCRISGFKARQKRTAFLRGLRFQQRCNEQHRVEATLFVRVRRIRGGRVITSRARDLVLAERRLQLAGGARTVRLTVAKRLRRHLGQRFTARVKIGTFDASGNRRTTSRRIRVR